jgi:drug/metabolite transporter (DMT)-like permease
MKSTNNINGNKPFGALVAFILAVIGTISLIIIKRIDDKVLPNKWILVPIVISIVSLFITFIGLRYTTFTILNMQWNVMSNIIVTIAGVLYFNEVHSMYEIIGLTFGFLSVMFLSFEHFFR